MAENRVIGRENALPWRLPADMRRFRELTTGHAVLMGRRTWESVGAPLPHRRNLVLTRDPNLRPAGIEVVHSLDDALALVPDDAEVFVAGGEQVYRLALPRADRIHLTVVHTTVDGDAVFPDFSMDDWRLAEDLRHAADARHPFDYSFRRYERFPTRRS